MKRIRHDNGGINTLGYFSHITVKQLFSQNSDQRNKKCQTGINLHLGRILETPYTCGNNLHTDNNQQDSNNEYSDGFKPKMTIRMRGIRFFLSKTIRDQHHK